MKTDKKAFTLIEVLISALILGFALGSLMFLFTKASMATEILKNTTIAANHARRVLEEMRIYNNRSPIAAEDWGQWGRDNALTTLDNDDCDVGNPSSDSDCEKIEVIYPSGTSASPLNILVKVTWEDRDARQRELQIGTLLTRR